MTTDQATGAVAERLAAQAAADPAALTALLAAAGPNRVPQPVREASGAALRLLAVNQPTALLDRWDELVTMLGCENAFSKMIATHLLGLLAPADREGRVAACLDCFFENLGDKVSVAGHVLQVCPEIVTAQPELEARVTAHILDLAITAKRERLGLLRSYAIAALDGYLPLQSRTPNVVGFVEEGLTDDSPKTRKLAAEVLARWREVDTSGPRS
jgi:hypothetical protein